MSMGPSWLAVSAASLVTAFWSVTSAGTATARPPVAVIPATTRPSASVSRPLTATATPLAARARQAAAPSALDPPVTRATLPARSGYSGHSVVSAVLVMTVLRLVRWLVRSRNYSILKSF
jgi:hypothetical protein